MAMTAMKTIREMGGGQVMRTFLEKAPRGPWTTPGKFRWRL
jgi:hypothetical protein